MLLWGGGRRRGSLHARHLHATGELLLHNPANLGGEIRKTTGRMGVKVAQIFLLLRSFLVLK